ncbi:MAG: substrate-binding domain-containing protein [Planctomycetales bacterium]
MPRRMARDHRGVAEALRNGWGDACISLQWVAEEYGLGFLGVRRERYDLCIPHSMLQDHRIAALLRAARSSAYHQALQGLSGVEARTAGELQ